MAGVSLSQQIEEVEQEVDRRRRAAKKPTEISRAEFHMKRMSAVLDTLKWLQRNEQKIKEALGNNAE